MARMNYIDAVITLNITSLMHALKSAFRHFSMLFMTNIKCRCRYEIVGNVAVSICNLSLVEMAGFVCGVDR